MKEIPAFLVKELRLRTGVSFLECKRALLEENGDIELSIDNLRKSGIMNAEKKTHNITNQGSIFLKTENNIGVMIELNCETDFVSKESSFVSFGQEIISTALREHIKSINKLKNIFERKRTDLILKLGENINIRRFHCISGENINSYIHGFKIGVLINSNNSNKTIIKNIAMHIAASKPEYLSPEYVPSDVFEREYQIQLELSKKFKKSPVILKKIVEGRMNKFINSISLTGQNFVMDPSKTVGDILNEYNLGIISFVRFELGEAIF